MSRITNSRNGNRKYAAIENLLQKKREALSQRLGQRLGDVSIHREPEDEAGLAVDSFATDLAVTTLERERRELAEIEFALQRIKASEYGICESCRNPIREARLEALPWARLCIRCAARTASVDMAAD
jgi:DnaK suppressor protein